MDDRVVVEVDRVTKQYAAHDRAETALRDVSFGVRRGSLVAVAGPSGSGKSTLLSIVGCLSRPTRGTVLLGGSDITVMSRRARRVLRRTELSNLLPQPSDNLFHRLDGVGNVRQARRADPAAPDEIVALLDRFGIAHCGPKRVIDMSGGEQQRLALVCALVRTPKLVIADEPTSSLDRTNARVVIDAFRQAIEMGTTVVVATHDHDLVDAATVAVHLSHGEVVGIDDHAATPGGSR
jgi:ABC-type lipoprotein export system ATPase subunit